MKTHKQPACEFETLIPLLIGVWRRFHKLSGPPDVLQTREFRGVVEAVHRLQMGLENSLELVGSDYFSDKNNLGAYLLYQFVLHYSQGLALINELKDPPRRVLDLASGPGAFALSALRHGAHDVVALDKNKEALQLAGEVCGRYGYPLTARQKNLLSFPYPVEGKFDLIILGYAIEELFPSHQKGWSLRQLEWIEKLKAYLTDGGKILFVENSFSHANQRLLALRDSLVEAGFPVQAPCVWKGKCPALENKTLCFAQRAFEKPYLIGEIQRAAKINLNSLKMSYLIVGKKGAPWPSLVHQPLYRIVSPPIETRGGKRYYLCGTDGKKDLGSHFNKQPKEAKAFEFLKRGELVSIERPLARGDHFDIIEGTELKVEAAVSKPLPEKEESSIF